MDGITISSAQTIGICLGFIVLGLVLKASPVPIWYPVLRSIYWVRLLNLPPAKIFLGDIGSITVGFIGMAPATTRLFGTYRIG